MSRYVSFRFDDGFLPGARKAAALLAPDHASFFIVKGLVEKTVDLTGRKYFSGQNFGNLEDWREMSDQGHDIQPHSVTHRKFSLLTRDEQATETKTSVTFIQQLHDGPYVFCHPNNHLTEHDFKSYGLSAAGFASRGSDQYIALNHVQALAPYRLKSWTVYEADFDQVVQQLRTQVPDNSWVILAFHSLDGEGWQPWTSEKFAGLVQEVRSLEYQIETIGAMVDRFAEPMKSASQMTRWLRVLSGVCRRMRYLILN